MGSQARWAPEGKEVFYIAPDGTMMAVRVQEQGDSIEHEIPERLFQTRIHGGGTAGVLYKQNYDVAPDGRFLINVDIEDVADIPVHAHSELEAASQLTLAVAAAPVTLPADTPTDLVPTVPLVRMIPRAARKSSGQKFKEPNL